MPTESGKPLIVISYAHADEPENPAEGEVKWLSFVTGYLRPAIKHGAVDLWIDRLMPGGADWEREIRRKLSACDIFILLVSRHSLSSDYVVDKEIAIIRDRQAKGEAVHFYPLVLTPTPKIAIERVRDKNLRPRDGKPLSGYSIHERYRHMSDAADEIATITNEIVVGPNAEEIRPDRSAAALLEERAIPEALDKQSVQHKAARYANKLVLMLNHELKNPLSGIRGAAQLIEANVNDAGRELTRLVADETDRIVKELNKAYSQPALALDLHKFVIPAHGIHRAAQLLEASVTDEDRALTRLICDETDRIVKLVNHMRQFVDSNDTQFEGVNIHAVLGQVKHIALSGWAKHVKILEIYDTSLPQIWGSRDQLMQVFLNLVKNAAEAIGPDRIDGVITLTTADRRERPSPGGRGPRAGLAAA
jgi:nitrogen-specific signal transduction histidine kinase